MWPLRAEEEVVPGMSARYILRFDDITPGMAWSKFLPLKQHIESLGIRCVLGVVPENRDGKLEVEPTRDDFFELVREWQEKGDTIVQHGAYHVYETPEAGLLGVNPRSEFAGLPYDVQLQKIREGKSILLKQGVWAPYFMAPGHSFDRNTLRALKAEGFVALTDGVGFHPYWVDGIKFIPQLLGRPFPFPFGLVTICLHVNSFDDLKMQRLLRFLDQYRDRFVCFHEVAQAPLCEAPVATWLRIVTAGFLKMLRMTRTRMLCS